MQYGYFVLKFSDRFQLLIPIKCNLNMPADRLLTSSYFGRREFANFVNDLNDFNVLSARQEKVYRKRSDPLVTYSDAEFRKKYCLNKVTVQKVIDLVKLDLLSGSNRGRAISPQLQVLCAIRYWARNVGQDDCAELHGFSQQTVSVMCRRVAVALAKKADLLIQMPASPSAQHQVMDKFKAIWQFPEVIGAIDCTHVKIKKVGGEDGPNYRNVKGYYSINVQIVCDADLRIRDIVTEWGGSAHDARIFEESRIRKRLENYEFRGRLLGDAAYPCTPHLFTPIYKPASQREASYNLSHITTRNTVEMCFSLWKQRFSCLLRGVNGSLETIKTTIVALAVLHNICIDMSDDATQEENANPEMDDDIVPVQNYSTSLNIGSIARSAFINRHF